MNRKQKALSHKRRERDITKLISHGFKVTRDEHNVKSFEIEIHGPKESLYENGVWRLNVEIPD